MAEKIENSENLELEELKPGAINSVDDIPEAQREGVPVKPQSRRSSILLGIAGISAIAGIGTAVWLGQPTLQSSSTAETVSTRETSATVDPSNSDPAEPASPDASDTDEDTVLGHRAYEEAPLGDLKPIVADGSIKLRTAAADQFEALVADAQAQGITILPLSGFRTFEDQKYLFFEVKAERGQTAERRAEVSAPPGYSEHHTGYAVDIIDGSRPETDLQESFETTAAFEWMQENAAYYGFELSFPKDNPQGIQYEPWHWRFVGDPNSLETFYKNQPRSPAPPQAQASP